MDSILLFQNNPNHKWRKKLQVTSLGALSDYKINFSSGTPYTGSINYTTEKGFSTGIIDLQGVPNWSNATEIVFSLDENAIAGNAIIVPEGSLFEYRSYYGDGKLRYTFNQNLEKINYYYDLFRRLSYTTDRDGKVLKKICYNYAGQQEDCSINTTPQWQAIDSLRCVLDGYDNYTGYQQRAEKDMNANSATYNTLRWVGNGYNPTACPLPVTCDYYNCTSMYGEGYACISGRCEQGFRINIDSYYSMGEYVCTYHYEYSDGSWSSMYVEYNYAPCPVW